MKFREVVSIKKAGIHVSIWLLILLLNFLFIKNFSIKVHIVYHIYFWLIYAALFYVNYMILMPKLFFRKKFALYTISSILLLLITFYIKQNIEFANMKKFRNEFSEFGREVAPPPQDFFPKKTPPLRNSSNWPEHKFSKPLHERKHMGGMMFFPLYGLALVFTASIAISLMQKWKGEEKHRYKIEKENIATELSFLKQQVNPHFLFNALNSIYSLTLNSSKPASEAVLKLSSILRYMLYETENKLVKLQDELEIITDYVALQQLRLTKNVLISYKVKGQAGGLQVAPLLLLPIIENAYKHGIDNANDSFIDIAILISKKQIELSVKNRIVNNELKKSENSGIGIANIKRRLDLLYPNTHNLFIDCGNNIYSVQLKINLAE